MKTKQAVAARDSWEILLEGIEKVRVDLQTAKSIVWKRINLGAFADEVQAKGLMDALRHIDAAGDLVRQHLSQLRLPEPEKEGDHAGGV